MILSIVILEELFNVTTPLSFFLMKQHLNLQG